MTKLIETYDAFTVVVVPFPFADKESNKTRPALVLSSEKNFNALSKASVMAMITTASHDPWPLDVVITDYKEVGLPEPSIVRMKLFTLDHRLVLRKIGILKKKDQLAVKKSLSLLLKLK